MRRRESLGNILILGLAVAIAATSMGIPGGLLAPEQVHAESIDMTTESGDQSKETQEAPEKVELRARVNEEYTAYIIEVTNLADSDTEKFEYCIGGETSYQSLAELEKKKFAANTRFVLYVRKAETETKAASVGTMAEITTPAASEAPVITGVDKFEDHTSVSITAASGAVIYYTTDGSMSTAKSSEYTAPIGLSATTTIRAIAVEDGHIMSAVTEKTFTREPLGGGSSGDSGSSGSSSGDSSSGSSSSGSGTSGDSSSGIPTGDSDTIPSQDDGKQGTTTRTETREDGTIVTTTEIRAEDGSVQIKTEIRNETTGMYVTVNVSKNANGKITSATAEIIDRGFGNVKISGEVLSEIVKAAGTKNVKTTIKMLTKNGWVIREVTVNAATLLKRTSLKNKKMKVIEIDPETGEKLVVSKTPFRAAADGSIELNHNELGYGIYELVTATQEEALTRQMLRSIKSAKPTASINEGKRVMFRIESEMNWYNVDRVTYLTGNPDVARVDSEGRITGLKPGKAIIRAIVRLKNGKSKVVRMTVTVNEKN